MGIVQRAYAANATAEPTKYGGLVRYETDKCELLKYPYGVSALDPSLPESAQPRVGTTVSFQLLASQVWVGSRAEGEVVFPTAFALIQRTATYERAEGKDVLWLGTVRIGGKGGKRFFSGMERCCGPACLDTAIAHVP